MKLDGDEKELVAIELTIKDVDLLLEKSFGNKNV